MKLKHSILTSVPAVPDTISPHLTMLSTCPLTPREYNLVNLSLSLIARYIASGNKIIDTIHANMVFFNKDELTILFDDENTYGNYTAFIMYPLYLWRSKNLSDLQILVCLLEEMCHCFWLIRDELAVKHKVVDVLKLLSPDISFSSVFSGDPPGLNPLCNVSITWS